jgi:DNA (cytosine-5)-methyltransferase 1
MKYIELFAGVGGFRYGIEQANEFAESRRSGQSELESKTLVAMPIQSNERQNTLTCVYSNEWDKYANSVYRKHYGECDNRDIREVGEKDIPDHELLVGGFPCQSFSVAGKRGGFADTRGTLFFEIARILKEKQPRLLLLENVKGLLSHDEGRTFGVILTTLDELGYDVQWQVLNSKNFGVPQNRERVFIVGHLRGTARPQVFPLGQSNANDINQLNQPTHSNDRIYGIEGLAPTLNTMQGGRRQPKIAPTMRANHHNTADVHFLKDGVKIRRLTPTESERLQGFPDGWTEGFSDTQRYKMMGNAVTTNVITAIAERLL